MKKIVLFLIISLLSIGLKAEDFKVGEAKYKVLADGTAELADYKKASGAVVIPENITNSKTGKVYEVTAIGKDAFKQSQITSIELPSTVTTIGSGAFKECAQLTTANLPSSVTEIPNECFYRCSALKELAVDFGDIDKVGYRAFESSGIGTVAPVYRRMIGSGTVYDMYGIYPKDKPVPTNIPLLIYSHVNMKDADIVSIAGNNPILIFKNNEPGQQALDVAENICKKMFPVRSNAQPAWTVIDNYLNGNRWQNEKTLREHMSSTSYSGEEPVCYFYFGTKESDDGISVTQEAPYYLYEAIEIANTYKNRDKFLVKMEEFVETAINDPDKLGRCYRDIKPEEAVKYDSYFTKTIYALCDSLYLIKPELSPAEIDNLYGFANNCLMHIGAEYGIANMNLKDWAKADLLNRDVDSPEHKEAYERILKLNDRLLKATGKAETYQQAMQMAALCGLGRWKEAAAYFPKVHRVATDNGVYAVPYELTYMQEELKKRGYKAVAPNYAKTKKVTGSDKSGLIEFFVSGAIEAGVNHYEKKRAERKAREMFYESVGLDKKGRLKK